VQITTLLIVALIAVESSGRDDAVGDGGASVGCLQIGLDVIEDVNLLARTSEKYMPEDRIDREKSIEICRAYLRYWGGQLEKREGRPATDKDLALIWNMGPYGYRKAHCKAGLDYWCKVEEILEKEEE